MVRNFLKINRLIIFFRIKTNINFKELLAFIKNINIFLKTIHIFGIKNIRISYFFHNIF
jgi:hypothetical protein